MPHYLLVASYTNEISTLSFDPASGSLTVSSAISVGHHPSWITFYPGDHSLVFTGLEQTEGKVIALKFDKDGTGTVVAEALSAGADPCALLATKDDLLVANYSGGSIAAFPISSEPPYLLATTPTTIQFNGSGPNTSRQEAAHPHQVFLLEQNEEVLVPDLGSDRVNRFKKASDGTWKLGGHVQYAAGGGPRHVAYHDGNLYTLMELTNTLVRHRFPPLPNLPSFVTSTPTMSNPIPLPNDMLAAEILIPPTNAAFPTPYLYLSNRNDPSPEGDIISIFSITNPDTLELVAEVRSGLQHVRSIVFFGPDDKWLIAGGVNGGGVKVFERVDGGKSLKVIATNEAVEAPTGFLWV